MTRLALVSQEVSNGIFTDVNEAVEAAKVAFGELEQSIDLRNKLIAAIRKTAKKHAKIFARMAWEETGYGRYEDKIAKNMLVIEKTPGIEQIEPRAFTGETGTTLIEYAPYGVIAAVTPSTNPSETVINNSINMIAAGNSVVFCPHPSANKTTCYAVSVLNEAIVAAGGPRNLLTCLDKPSKEESQQLMIHPEIKLNVVTGGGGVVKRAMQSGKRCIAAGPGNPPVVVDETADIAKAARDIVAGASLDNGIICIAEKEVIVVDTVADQLIREMKKAGCYQINSLQAQALKKVLLSDIQPNGKHGTPNRNFVGKNPSVILKEIGVEVSDDVRLIIFETNKNNPFVWSETLMPVLPIVRVKNSDEAIDFAVEVEQGYHHTASIHSKNIDTISKMAKLSNTSIFVANAATSAGLGFGGEGYTSFTISSPTGEGLSTAKTFSRERRCTIAGSFRII